LVKLFLNNKEEKKTYDNYSEVNGKIIEVNNRLNVVKKRAPKEVTVDLSEDR